MFFSPQNSNSKLCKSFTSNCFIHLIISFIQSENVLSITPGPASSQSLCLYFSLFWSRLWICLWVSAEAAGLDVGLEICECKCSYRNLLLFVEWRITISCGHHTNLLIRIWTWNLLHCTAQYNAIEVHWTTSRLLLLLLFSSYLKSNKKKKEKADYVRRSSSAE